MNMDFDGIKYRGYSDQSTLECETYLSLMIEMGFQDIDTVITDDRDGTVIQVIYLLSNYFNYVK